MSRFRNTLIAFGIFLLPVGIGSWIYYKQQYPYGSTHRCSKNLAMDLKWYADSHDGNFPSSENPDALGLSAYVAEKPELLDLVVGKADDLKKAQKFYQEHSYLLPEHSSWHYIEGLTTNDRGALAWDKIPLGHYGQIQSSNSREVIMTDGTLRAIPEDKWAEFLKAQEEFAAKR